MGVHPFPGIDPATNYLTMTGGPGAGPMHAYSAAMSTVATSADDVVIRSGANTVMTADHWSGSAQIQAVASVGELNATVTDAATKAALKAQLAQAAGELHTMTVARMVPHVVVNANRAESLFDNAINPLVWGALTPRITELELEYLAMWANNAQAGVSYGFGVDAIVLALGALSALPALAGGSLGAPVMAGAQIAETATISGLGAAMSTAEQAATAAISPAAAATTSTPATTSLLGNTALAAPASASGVQPLAAVHTPTTPTTPSLAQAQTPVSGMFVPPPTAAITAPAPSPSVPQPATASIGPSTGTPGITSFVKPAEPFAMPPTTGRAGALAPGMLNAAALRGPVSTMPLTTTTATSTLATTPALATTSVATGAKPLAYVPPDVPRPVATPPPPQPPLDTSGTVDTLNPPPAPPAPPPPPPAPPAPTPVAPPQGGPPAPSDGPDPGPGSGGPGPGVDFQMLGTGLGGAPLAPPGIPPMPLDPTPAQIAQMDAQEARAALDQYNADQALWNSQCDVNIVGRLPLGPYNACLDRLAGLNARRTAIIARLNQLGIPVEDLPPGVTAPPNAVPNQPGPPAQPAQPSPQQPNPPTGPNLNQQAAQIGEEVKAIPKGSGQLQTLADKITALHLDQEQAAEATDIAAKTAFGETSGIAKLPDGTEVVLPKYIPQGVAMMVHPDGSVTVFKGDLTQFLPYIGK
jgi:PPE family